MGPTSQWMQAGWDLAGVCCISGEEMWDNLYFPVVRSLMHVASISCQENDDTCWAICKFGQTALCIL